MGGYRRRQRGSSDAVDIVIEACQQEREKREEQRARRRQCVLHGCVCRIMTTMALKVELLMGVWASIKSLESSL